MAFYNYTEQFIFIKRTQVLPTTKFIGSINGHRERCVTSCKMLEGNLFKLTVELQKKSYGEKSICTHTLIEILNLDGQGKIKKKKIRHFKIQYNL